MNQSIERTIKDQYAQFFEEDLWSLFKESADYYFETAAKIRDQILSIENILEKQIVESDLKYNQDVLFFGNSHTMVLEIKNGMLLKTHLFNLPVQNSYIKTCESFLMSRYKNTCPDELIINITDFINYTVF